MRIPDTMRRAICEDCSLKLQQKDRICCIDPYSEKNTTGRVARINLCEKCFDQRVAAQLSYNNGDITLKEFNEIKNPPQVTEKPGRKAEKNRRKADRRKAQLKRKITFTQEVDELLEDDHQISSVH